MFLIFIHKLNFSTRNIKKTSYTDIKIYIFLTNVHFFIYLEIKSYRTFKMGVSKKCKTNIIFGELIKSCFFIL